LLAQAAASGIKPRYVSQLSRTFPQTPASKTAVRQPLLHPLSERELEVLALLTSHLSGPEIAEQLHISPNTFKTHTKNIYGKLDVKSRGAAVSRARELGLLS
jgi:LuxR family maltose regulon positive regulatory protein